MILNFGQAILKMKIQILFCSHYKLSSITQVAKQLQESTPPGEDKISEQEIAEYPTDCQVQFPY